MIFAGQLLAKHSFLFATAISVPLLIFFYFGHIRLSPFWVQPKILSEGRVSSLSNHNGIFTLADGDVFLFAKSNVNLNNVNTSIYQKYVTMGSNIRPFVFDPYVDVIVMLHIQKTGGSSFGRRLAIEIVNLTCTRLKAGRKQHDCSLSFPTPIKSNLNEKHSKKAIWMFSRFSVGWACGLHADWTELTGCIDKVLNSRESFNRTRRYHFVTMLREPVSRYISEWRHIARGATWAGAELRCNGRQASLSEVPFCYNGNNWRGVSLSEFVSCEHNLANNRETRMLANLSVVNCYNKTGMTVLRRSQTMLQSALENLASFSFFGLSEYQHLTQWVFEHTFTNLRFKVNLTQKRTKAQRFMPTLTTLELHKVRNVNFLDLILYDFAKQLFFERLGKLSKAYGVPPPSETPYIDSSVSDEDDSQDLDLYQTTS